VPDITQLSSTNSSFVAAFFCQQSILGAAIGMRLIIAADIGTFILAVNY
jgi:hypothetical protein